MTFSLNDRKSIIMIIVLSLMVYVPYIFSFNNMDSERNYWSGDSWWYMQIVESMVQNGDLDMSNNIPASIHVNQDQLALSSQGYLAPKHGIFFPLVSIPFYLLFGDAGYPLFNLLLTIGILIVMYLIIRVFFDEFISLSTTLIYAFTSVIFLYSYDYLSDLWSVLLILLGVNLILRRKYYTASIFLALAVFAKITNVIWIIPIYAFIGINLWKEHKRQFGILAQEVFRITLIFSIMITPVLASNYLIYGSPFTTGYQRIVSYSSNGSIVLLAHTNDFNKPFFHGLFTLLFSQKKGMLWDNYILIFAVLGMVFSHQIKQTSMIILLLIIILLQIIFFSKYDYTLATEFGNRFLYLSIALSSVFTANFINILRKRLIYNPKIAH